VTARDEEKAGGVVCYAGVDWWYHNRGHSECQVMTRLAEEHRVLWVNSIGMRMPSPGSTDLVFSRIWSKLRSLLRGLRKDESGMWILSPFFIPRYTPRMLRLNGWLLRMQVALARRVARIDAPSAWLTIPTATPAIVGPEWHRVVANRCDDYAAFPEIDREMVGKLQHDMLDVSDVALYVNHELQDREAPRARTSVFLGHGVDVGHFSPPYGDEPEALRDLPRPILGFYGALDDYRFDIDLFVAVARAHPEATVVVCGPQAMDLSPLEAEANIVYLGAIPYEELPAYASRFDVGLMPWLRNEFIEACNPIKLKEYLALGYPIASIDFPELAPYASLVHSALDEESFLEAVDAALAEVGDDERMAERRATVAADDWDVIAERCETLLGLRS
jgi:hypothetical protein